MVNQKPGMEDIVSDKHILLIDRKGETDIIPVPAVFRIFIVFFLAVFLRKLDWVLSGAAPVLR